MEKVILFDPLPYFFPLGKNYKLCPVSLFPFIPFISLSLKEKKVTGIIIFWIFHIRYEFQNIINHNNRTIDANI